MATTLQQEATKVLLTADQVPRRWYNILADLPAPLPLPLNPATREPIGPEALAPLFPMELIKQEVSQDRFVDIPDEVREAYLRLGRPSPLHRASRLERALKTPARIFYKREDLSPTGSHKPNTAIAQAYYSAQEGVEKLTTETGAGQWGSALSLAAAAFDLACTVFMVRVSYNQKPYRKILMQVLGAEVHPSPSEVTAYGRRVRASLPDHPGSLGIAVSEGLEEAREDDDTVYCLGSVLNHVLLHQTVIGLETKAQFERVDDYPDLMVSCLGGGSNFGGFVLPFVADALQGREVRFLATQSEAAPNLQGEYRYDHADHAELTPELMMYTLGHRTEMRPILGDGLRYHAAAPVLSLLRHHGYVDTLAYPADEEHVFRRAQTFVRTEGFLPAPESAYGVAGAIDEALRCRETGEERVIAFNVSGHGLLDIQAYREKLAG